MNKVNEENNIGNKGINILKVSNYDKFKCVADKCRFTCCEGWDVSIDNDTYIKLESENHKTDYILEHVQMKKCGSEREYFIEKETHEACPFLDKQGLCNIVKRTGEEYLSLTCYSFPRMENVFEDSKELTLSCACPEVVEIIDSLTGKINISSESQTYTGSNLLELKIREYVVNIIQQENFSLEHKLIISFQMLLTILENENFEEDSLVEDLEKYKSREYIQVLIDMYEEIEVAIEDSIIEMNNLFLDITQEYKAVSILKVLLEDIYDFAEEVEVEELSVKWHGYKGLFEQHNQLIENCITSKILSSCVSNDIEDMIIAFQMIIIEYLLVRYAVFLKYCMNEDYQIDAKDVKDYIVAFSRIIGNNDESVIEFFEDGFGEAILDNGYLCFITLF